MSDLIQLIYEYSTVQELKEISDLNSLSKNGSKEQLFKRLQQKFESQPTKKFLSLFSYDTLNNIRKDHDIKGKGLFGTSILTKGQVIDLLLETFLIKGNAKVTSEKIEEVIEDKTEKNEEKTSKHVKVAKKSVFDELADNIRCWAPKIRNTTEDGYRVDLGYYLENLGYRIRMEEGATKADLLVDNSIPIEIKKEPRGADYDRAVGQVVRHYKAHGSVIVVVMDVKKRDQFDDFVENVQSSISGKDVVILRK